jgi:hypothetical protein
LLQESAFNKYEDIEFEKSQLPLFIEVLKTEKLTSESENNKIRVFDVFQMIVCNTPPNGAGTTKKQIQEELGLSRKVCDDLICILYGATLIHCGNGTKRDIPWIATVRGLQLAAYLSEISQG